MKFHILIFGCQMNYADSARIRAILTHCGFTYTEEIQEADIVIFDTCSVRQKSEDKITGKLKQLRPDQKVRITGCMIQHNMRSGKLKAGSEKLKVGNFLGSIKTTHPEIIGFTTEEINDNKPIGTSLIKGSHTESRTAGEGNHDSGGGFIGINNAFNPQFYKLHKTYPQLELMRRIDDTGFLPLILPRLGYDITYEEEILNEYEKILPQNINTSMLTQHTTSAYIPISTGCNQFCSYCIVPYARGLEKYFPVEDIVQEAQQHLQNGAKELTLLGQIVNKHPQFTQILQKILKLEGLERLRYTSPYPTYYSQELLHLHDTQPKLCPHIHIPFQSGSDKILQAMHRGYSLAQAKKFLDDIHGLKRKISITTDIIVGFPGETEEDFQETLDLVAYGQFDMIYIGIYSPRPGTLAAKKLKDDIPYATKHARRQRLNTLLTRISQANNQKEVGESRMVLIDEIQNDSKKVKEKILGNPQKKSSEILLGHTDNMKQIILKLGAGSLELEAGHRPGNFVHVKITQGVPFKLYGEII